MLSLSEQGKLDDVQFLSHLPVEATMLPLSHLMPRGLGDVRLIKMDVQGYECKVLRGAWPLFSTQKPHSRAQHGLQLIASEMDSDQLHSQCCTGHYLTHMLRAVGVPRALDFEKDQPITQRAICSGVLFGNDTFTRQRLCATFGPEARRVVPTDGTHMRAYVDAHLCVHACKQPCQLLIAWVHVACTCMRRCT